MGAICCFGVVAMVVSDIINSIIEPGYNPIAQSISLLARHKLHIAQDIGLYLVGFGTLACATGLYLLTRNSLPRRIMVILVWVGGLDIFVLTVFDTFVRQIHYAYFIHNIATIVLIIIFVVVSYIFVFTVNRSAKTYFRIGLSIAIFFSIMIAGYNWVPNNWNGVYERLIILNALIWLGMVSYILIRRDRDRALT